MRPSADSLLVWTGASCVYGCAACPIDAAVSPAAADGTALHRRLVAISDREGRLVLLVGGEPFLRSDVLRLLATIRADGCQPGVVTTGVALGSAQVRDKLRRAGLAYLRVQVFGCGETHDAAVSVPGAYAKIITGLRDWLSEGDGRCDVDVGLTLRGRPADGAAREIEQLARDIGSAEVQIALNDETDGGIGQREAAAALHHWNDDAGRPLLAFEGMAEAAEPASCMTIPLPGFTFVGAVPRASCLGVGEEIAARSEALARRTRSNSFNFVRSGATVPFHHTADACTAYRVDEDTERSLWLVGDDADNLVGYVTDTGDFEPHEIARIKDEWSHIFVDRAAAGVLDDFREGMRRVLPDPTCDACANRDGCARRFRVVAGQPFAAEESWIADYVVHLRGRVFDVGCGEQLYRDEIVPLVRAGSMSYTGLDPDEPSLDEWRAILPEGRFIRGGIEEYRGAPASYDRLLCLRSLNHVIDLDEAIARMAYVLKPGGQLLIVETTPFAMLRQAEQVAAADRARRAGHQHFRNVTSEDVLAYVHRRSLKVLHHHPVGLSTTNEWILLLEK